MSCYCHRVDGNCEKCRAESHIAEPFWSLQLEIIQKYEALKSMIEKYNRRPKNGSGKPR
jgi:tRNA G26 N,N-dimethylase Trm1